MGRTRLAITRLAVAVVILAALGGCIPELADTTPPDSPSDLAASAVDESRIQLSWTDNSNNEDEFQIQRGIGAGFLTIDQVGPDSNAYLDSGLESNTSYTYRLRATNDAGESGWTSEADATTGTVTSYTVTYWGNGYSGGIVPSDGAFYQAGDPVTVVGSGSMTLSGSTFVGWNTESGGTGTDYGIGSIFLMPAADVDLYAQWTTNPTFTVTYHGNGADGGDVPTDPNVYETGTMAPVFGPGTMTCDGYGFVEWNTLPGGTGVSREAGDDFMMGTANVDLYAQWIATPTFTVTYYGNGADGGEAPIDAAEYYEGDPVTVLGPGTLSLTDGEFVEWNTEADGSGVPRDPGDEFTTGDADVELHAQWEANEYQLFVQAGFGGTIVEPAGSPVAVGPGDVVTVTAEPGLHYHFTQWQLISGTATIDEVNSESTTVTIDDSDASVIAHFAWDTYELSLASETGGAILEPMTSPVTVDHGAATTISAEADSGAYLFDGWAVTSGSAILASATSATTTVRLESGNATVQAQWRERFSSARYVSEAADGCRSVFAVDVNGDTHIDILSANWYENSIAWYENDGTEGFTKRVIATDAYGARSVFGIDLDGDGDIDPVVGSTSDDTVAWYENNGSEGFTERVITTSSGAPSSVFAVDLDYDGDIDVVSSIAVEDSIVWFENDGSQSFAEHVVGVAIDAPGSAVAVDLDGDLDVDVAAAGYNGNTINWYENDGSENFTGHVISTTPLRPSSVFVVDIDGDSDCDVLSASEFDSRIAWHENDGSQSFSMNTITSGTPLQPRSVCAADLDGDDDIDVISAALGGDTVTWHENDGVEGFTSHVVWATGDGPSSVLAVDLDSDGDTDIVAAFMNDDTIAWFENMTIE